MNTAPWSEGALEKQSSEQKARSAVNGAIKTKVVLTLHEEVAPSVAGALICLNRAYGKLKALIGPSYNHHDLEVHFNQREWRISLVGFLYSEEYEGMNTKIAGGERDTYNNTSEIC